MRRGTRFGVVGILIITVVASFVCTQPRWKGTITNEGSVIVVRNPKDPLYQTPVLELKEDLAIGGEGAQGEYAMGDLRDVVVDDNGTIYVLDWQNSRVQVFDQAGRFVRTIGRKGQGPGELEIPMTMSLVRKSGELAVHQATGRISFFRTDGTFLRHLQLKTLGLGRGLCDSQGMSYVIEVRVGDNGPRYVVQKLVADGTVTATLAEAPVGNDSKFDPFRPIIWCRIDRSDNFIYGYPETYEIRLFGANSKLFKKIARDYDPVAVTAEERAEQEKAFEGRGTTFDFSKYHAAYRWFFLSDLGHIFVATFEKTTDGKTIHDIFDPEGRFIGRIPLKRMGVGIFKGKYYAHEEDEEGFPVLKRYAVTWLVK